MSVPFLIKNRIIKYFHCGASKYDSTEEMRKLYLINTFNLIAFFFVFPFGVNALYKSLYMLAFTLLSISFILIVNYFYLKFSQKKEIASFVISTLFFILFAYLIYSGGVNKTGPLWIYPFPMIVMFLLGFRQGILYMTLFFILIIFILFGLDISLYQNAFKLRIVLSLLLVTFLASVYEYLREKTFERMNILSKQLEDSSNKDYLTQVYNRRGIHKELENACTHYHTDNKNFSLIICDIDYFKKINDNYGHIAGDEVLKKVASEIKSIIRKDDVLARWGGEEFLVLLPNASMKAAYKVGEKIRKSIENTSFKYNKHTIAMTVSIGVAEKDNELPISDIISQADAHMYAAKKEGRNTVYPRPKGKLGKAY